MDIFHSAERRKECSAINSSLMALKEIMRAKATGSNKFAHFYRKSKLTMVTFIEFFFHLLSSLIYF